MTLLGKQLNVDKELMKQYRVPTIEELLAPAYRQLLYVPNMPPYCMEGSTYILDESFVTGSGPLSEHKTVGITLEGHRYTLEWFQGYPKVFKRLQWWEAWVDSIDVFLQVKYVKVMVYEGYWRVGDVVAVHGYEIINGENDTVPKFKRFLIGRRNMSKAGLHSAYPHNVLPATKAEFEEFRKESGVSA